MRDVAAIICFKPFQLIGAALFGCFCWSKTMYGRIYYYKANPFFAHFLVFLNVFYSSVILPDKLTENTFSIRATTWGIVTGRGGGMNVPNVTWE